MIFAAFETTSGALTHIIHKLAENQDVQERLRKELVAARDGRDMIPYDELVALPYLEAICRETLRLYAPIATINRRYGNSHCCCMDFCLLKFGNLGRLKTL